MRHSAAILEVQVNLQKWARLTTKLVALAAICFMFGGSADATTIIIAFQKDRIILLADSRATELNLSGTTVRDDKCKLAISGKEFAFAETGQEGYTRADPNDPVPDWHGTSEAIKAYNTIQNHDVLTIAQTWAIQVTNYFQLFFLVAPQRVRSLTNQVTLKGILLVGVFVGHDSGGSLKAYIVRIALDDGLLLREPGSRVPIGYSIDKLEPREEPYSTESITQELLDGKTERAKKVTNEWAKESTHLPKAGCEVRRLQFLIRQTGNYDKTVHGPVNALFVSTKTANWIENDTCKGQMK